MHEMFAVKDRRVLDYVPDYKLNLIVPEEIKDFDKFKTELGPLLEFISYADSGKKLRKALQEKETRWESLSNEAVDLLNTCLDAKLEINNCTEEGVLLTLLQLVRDGLLTLSVGAERAGMSEAAFQKLLKG